MASYRSNALCKSFLLLLVCSLIKTVETTPKNMLRTTLLCLFFMSFFFSLFSQETKEILAKRTATPIRVDGLFLEADWQQANWQGDFKQYEPENGAAPSQRTKFAVLYDNNNLYVAVFAYDNQPELIEKRLARRDNEQGDQVEIQIDSYNDKRTAFVFKVSAAGVKSDGISSNDGDNYDSNWNPIWIVKTNINSEGWVAEAKIPLDQLRFNAAEDQNWGLQIGRTLFRKKEYCLWNNFSLEATGWAQHFGRLKNLKGLSPKRLIEATPYALGGYESYEREEGNPYKTGSEWRYNVGVDGKIGVTNDLTLDFSVNPDFGQVEADPSQVNLSGFEVFFREQRPFFVEGKNITDFRLTSFGGRFRNDNLFYSRRIGRKPQHSPDDNDDQDVDKPDKTRILGAVKLTGKTKSGWSVGVVETVTAEEKAEITKREGVNGHTNIKKSEEVVEPLTNYLAARLQKDLNGGNTQIGGMFTSTNRKIDHDHLNFMHYEAYSGAVDFAHAWKDRTYYLKANMAVSRVNGHKDAILDTQTSNRRLFQRPDASYVDVDSSATSLSGYSGELAFGKSGSQGLRYLISTTVRSPRFEINDLGSMRSSDIFYELMWVGYRWGKPFSIFRNLSVGAAQWYGVNYGGDRVSWGLESNANMEFKNYWEFGSGLNYDGITYSPNELRGGPVLRQSGGVSSWTYIESDSRKKLRANVGMFNYWGAENQSRYAEFWGGINYRPIKAMGLSTSFNFSRNRSELQYVNKISEDINEEPIDTRYVFSDIKRRTFSMTFRIDLSLTPDLSIQYYGQPFIGTGLYDKFKEITDSRAKHISDRYQLISSEHITYSSENEEYTVTEPEGSTYTFGKPDFNTKVFLSNLVLRWEYLPGSTLFLVWSQNREGYHDNGRFQFSKDIRNMFREYPSDVFLVKLSYRIPI